MKIVQVCPYDMHRPGGVQTHIRDLSNWLRAQGHEVLVIAPPSASRAAEPGVRTLGKPRAINFQGTHFEICYASPREMNRIAADLRDFGAEVLHLHTPWTPLLPWQVWRKTGLPAVATFHATLPEGAKTNLANRLLHGWARFFINRMRASIVPSISPLRQLEKVARGHAITVLPPTIDLSDWRAAAEGAAKSQSDAVSILFLGRLETRKGVQDLLDAWAVIAPRLPNATLTFAGRGDLDHAVIKAVKNQPDGRLRFISGPDQHQAQALMAAADIFVAPSQFGESFGIVLIEAMAAGAVPIAAANSGYVTVMTGPGEDLLYPPGDSLALAEKIETLTRDAAMRARLRAWGQEHSASYDVSAVGPAYEQIFLSAATPEV